MNKIIQARKLWTESVHTHNLYNVMQCYHKNHVFKGTLNAGITTSTQETEFYFEKLFKFNPTVTFIKSDIMSLNDVYIDYGTYSFNLSDSGTIYANYQFTYKMINSSPKIISHFSCKI